MCWHSHVESGRSLGEAADREEEMRGWKFSSRAFREKEEVHGLASGILRLNLKRPFPTCLSFTPAPGQINIIGLCLCFEILTAAA